MGVLNAGPVSGNLRFGIESFEAALKLNEHAQQPLDVQHVEIAKTSLSRLRIARRWSRTMGSFFSADENDDDMTIDDDDDEYDDDE